MTRPNQFARNCADDPGGGYMRESASVDPRFPSRLWSPWSLSDPWTSRDDPDWRHSSTLKFEYNASDLYDLYLKNCGGNRALANRLAAVFEKRILRWNHATRWRADVRNPNLTQLEIVPFPAHWTFNADRVRVEASTRVYRAVENYRKVSLMSVRWLMRALLELRRDFDPTLRGEMRRQ